MSSMGRSTPATRPAPPVARPHLPSLVAGLALVALGAVLLLDALDAYELRFAALAPVACAAVGAILLAAGLSRSD
jgi:hypothetical protein